MGPTKSSAPSTLKRRGNLFLRGSFLRMLLGMRKFLKTWQAGDGREEKLLKKVLSTVKAGDPLDVIRVIDDFAWGESFLMNVGDEKGVILDNALIKADPKRILELGTYCGYSALRMAVAAPKAHITSIEFSAANKAVAEGILAHAGVGDRVTIVHGTLGDGGKTIDTLNREHNFSSGSLDFVFIDHDKKQYLSDLKLIIGQGWLHKGSVVVADNIKFPGAPDYSACMDAEEGKTWRTQAHETHVEYQSVMKDVVLESEYLGYGAREQGSKGTSRSAANGSTSSPQGSRHHEVPRDAAGRSKEQESNAVSQLQRAEKEIRVDNVRGVLKKCNASAPLSKGFGYTQ